MSSALRDRLKRIRGLRSAYRLWQSWFGRQENVIGAYGHVECRQAGGAFGVDDEADKRALGEQN